VQGEALLFYSFIKFQRVLSVFCYGTLVFLFEREPSGLCNWSGVFSVR